MNEQWSFDVLLDAQGLICPEPIMLLHHAIGKMDEGQIVKVFSTDPTSQRDVIKFCTFLGHDLLEKECDELKKEFYYLICKGSAESTQSKNDVG